jgi:ABC-type oligopeptide transport system ATPase subunit
MVYLGQGRPLGIPMPVIIFIGTAIVMHILLAYTRYGRHTLAIGDNENAAKTAGINVSRHRLSLYTLSGALAGLAGLIFATRVNAGDPTAGLTYELTAITAAIIGGTNLFGGRASILGTMIGALIMGVLQNGLNLLAVQSYYQQMAIGAVLILAVFIDQWQVGRKPGYDPSRHQTSPRASARSACSHGVDMSVDRGEVVGLVGDNGAGKSTLMKIVTGMYTADRGRSRSTATDILTHSPGERRRMGIEMIYQDLALAKQQDVAANIFLGREPQKKILGMNFVDRATMRRRGAGDDRPARRAAAGAEPAGRVVLRRSAAIGRHRPRADLRPEARHHGRTHRRARRARGAGRARPDPAAEAGRHRGDPDLAPSQRRAVGDRPDRGAQPWPRRRQPDHRRDRHDRSGVRHRRRRRYGHAAAHEARG